MSAVTGIVGHIEYFCKKISEFDAFLSRQGSLVETWDELVDVTDDGGTAVVADAIEVTSAEVITTGAIEFIADGKLMTNGRKITLDVPVKNRFNRHVFHEYVLDETYPARWSAQGSTINGTFGGNPNRDPRWWGMKASLDEFNEVFEVAKLNNDAIAAALLSHSIPNKQIYVNFPEGHFVVHRTIRMDGLRATLQGPHPAAMNNCRITANTNNFRFDDSHYILTDDYGEEGDPTTDGTTPVVQIGSEIQNTMNNPDEGFMSNVRNLTIRCPHTPRPVRRISGIMWEAQLQEGSSIEYVNVQNYAGYAIGGPRFQRLYHNGPPQGYYLQLNTVRFNDIWIFTTVVPDAIGMSIYGLNFHCRNITIGHKGAPGGMTTPAIITGARTCGTWENVHIEHNPKPDTEAIGIHVPDTASSAERLSFDSINLLGSAPITGDDTSFTTLRVDASRGGITARNISTQMTYNYLGGARAIRDVYTNRESAGFHNNQSSSDWVAHYSRQMRETIPQVSTSDEALDPYTLVFDLAETTLDPDEFTTLDAVLLPFSRKGDFVAATYSDDPQGVKIDAWVESTNFARVRITNPTAAAVTLAAGKIRLKAMKLGSVLA